MEDNRTQRLAKIIKSAAATFLELESNHASLITVTDIKFSKDGKYATILFTVFPEDKQDAVLDFAKRKRSEFKQHIKSHTKIGIIPLFDFDIDYGEKHRQKIDLIPLN